MLNKRYIKSIKRDIFCFDFAFQFSCFNFSSAIYWKGKIGSSLNDMFQFPFYFKSFKRDIIALISFLILFVSISFLVNIEKEMSLPGFRIFLTLFSLNLSEITYNKKIKKFY